MALHLRVPPRPHWQASTAQPQGPEQMLRLRRWGQARLYCPFAISLVRDSGSLGNLVSEGGK